MGCTKEFLEIHSKNAKVVAAFSHVAASCVHGSLIVSLILVNQKINQEKERDLDHFLRNQTGSMRKDVALKKRMGEPENA